MHDAEDDLPTQRVRMPEPPGMPTVPAQDVALDPIPLESLIAGTQLSDGAAGTVTADDVACGQAPQRWRGSDG